MIMIKNLKNLRQNYLLNENINYQMDRKLKLMKNDLNVQKFYLIQVYLKKNLMVFIKYYIIQL